MDGDILNIDNQGITRLILRRMNQRYTEEFDIVSEAEKVHTHFLNTEIVLHEGKQRNRDPIQRDQQNQCR